MVSLRYRVVNDSEIYIKKLRIEPSDEPITPLELSIPEKIDGMPVVHIADKAFCDPRVSITSVKFPNTLRTIGKSSFFGCVNLKELYIPGNIKEIGTSAFAECSSLKNIQIENGVETLRYGCFAFCSALTSITLPNTLDRICANVFLGCNNLSSLTIPAGTHQVDIRCFTCRSLKTIRFEGTETEIFGSPSYLRPITIYCKPNSCIFNHFSGAENIRLKPLMSNMETFFNSSKNIFNRTHNFNDTERFDR